MEFHHTSVLLKEAVDLLNVRPGGVYVDGTAGGGGHSLEIATRLQNGRLICLDRDADAVRTVTERLSGFAFVTVVKANYSEMDHVLSDLGIAGVDGILLDLGVSSYQLDTPERGFSYHDEAPLDMRMDRDNPLTARDVVNTYPLPELARILREYGEESHAYEIAKAIVRSREREPIETTTQLSGIIASALPPKVRRQSGHPARKAFQAIRIEVNGELDHLKKALHTAVSCLNKGGRLSVITFHSLEDRMVKQAFQTMAHACTCPKDFPVCVCGNIDQVKILTRKPMEPSALEIEKNIRSRSAKLRGVEKIVEGNTYGEQGQSRI